MTQGELTGRTARAAAALQRWTDGGMPPDIVPALAAELRVVAAALVNRCVDVYGSESDQHCWDSTAPMSRHQRHGRCCVCGQRA